MKYVAQHCVAEWSFTSGKAYYPDPFNDVELDVIFSGPDGAEQRVPAFWAGEQTWGVRFSAPTVGTYRYRAVCSDTTNADLHAQEGTLMVTPYAGHNALLQHGRL